MEKCNDCENGLIDGKFCRVCDGVGWTGVRHDQKAERIPGTLSGENMRYSPDEEARQRRIALYAARHRNFRDLVAKGKMLVDETTSVFYHGDPPVVPPAACSGSLTLEALSRCAMSADCQSEFDDDDFDEDETL